MKEKIVELLMSKVGLDQAKAEQAFDTMMGFVKENPQMLSSYLEKFSAGGVAEKLGGLLG